VLVVDDCLHSREKYAAYLRYAGFNVEVATNGQQAVEMALRFVPAVILMDMQVPGIDACEVTRTLKGNPRTSPIPVVAVSAPESRHVSSRVLEAGCAIVVSKPCEPQHLVACVLRALRSARQTASA
jgi:CheY-like chemotaxis protein